MTHLSARSLSKMAHIYKLRRDKLLELIEAENSWWLPPPSSLKPPTAERVCRQDCVGPVCQERCVETEGRGDRT